MYYIGSFPVSPKDEEIRHFGIIRQKWGVRRFQNKDGSLTPEGRERYRKAESAMSRHTTYSGAKNAKKFIEKEEIARERGYRVAMSNKNFMDAYKKEHDYLYKDSELHKKEDAAWKRSTDAKEKYDKWNNRNGLYRFLTKKKGSDLRTLSDAARKEWSDLSDELHMSHLVTSIELAKKYFNKKEYREIEAWLADEFDYQIFD